MTNHLPIPPLDARFWALIPSAGTGSRAGVGGPKQYEPLLGQPLVMHTLAAFSAVPRIEKIAVVLAPQDVFFATLPLPSSVLIAPCGGATRAGSVLNGLNFLHTQGASPHDWVLVHDAARCLITPAQINALMDACANDAVGGLLAHKLPDTLKCEALGRVASTLERSDKWLAQTPQMFRLGDLLKALALAGDQVTDESSALEALGLSPKLVPGSAQNFKVTYPEDFALAEAVLRARLAAPETLQTNRGKP
jgi:2-C-methyl-D-erythritol 4-phosphate cytidylyltransferase